MLDWEINFLYLVSCMTSYRDEDIAEVDPTFGVQLHHPRFLECIGALESAQLLCRSPAEWVRTMDNQDAISAALQLQRDTGFITSNLQVLRQYVTSLNWMSSEVMRLAFGPELFPSGAVNVVAPVPRVHSAATQMSAYGDHRLAQAFLGRCLCFLVITV